MLVLETSSKVLKTVELSSATLSVFCLKKDNLIQKASIKRFLFVKEDPLATSSEQVFSIAKKIAQILERKVLVEEEKGLSRFFKKILRF